MARWITRNLNREVKGDRLVFQFGRISVAPFFLSQKAGRKCQLNVGSHERARFLSGGGQKTANAAGSRLGQGPTLLEIGRVLGLAIRPMEA